MTRHAYPARRTDWRGIGWWLAAAAVAVLAAFAWDAPTGIVAGIVVLLIGVVLS